MKSYHENTKKLNRDYPTPTHCSPLTRVSRRYPCKACGRTDWCSFTEDCRLAFCMRTAQGSFKQAANGAYLHRLTNEAPPVAPIKRPSQTSVQATPRASAEHCDAAYEALLYRHLVLAKEHHAKLLARGLDPVTIRVNGYASVPTAAYAANVTRALAPMQLEGVPGFYREGGHWRMVRMEQGFFVPVRDVRGRICGLMIRRDGVVGSGKYIWLSSRDRNGGASSSAPAHFANPYKLREAEEIVITEGALKSQIIACLTSAPVIGIAGVSSFSADFATRLKESCPNLRRVAVAYDKDLIDKKEVYDALMRLTALLEKASFCVRIRTWPGSAKGFDDFLLSQLIGQEVAA
jgi:hypothetical protein